MPILTASSPGTAGGAVDLAASDAFNLGGAQVIPAELVVVAGGARHELQPRVMQVLVALGEARPAVVSRDTLIERCWDGRIVGDDAVNRCILALRHLAQQIDPQPYAIETVPRVGHRLVEHPRVGMPKGDALLAHRPNRTMAIAMLVAILLTVAIASALFWWQASRSGSEAATIAVLPFRDLTNGNPFIAEGISEEIAGQLSREGAFQVAGRTSSAQFRDAGDLRDVGRKLGVDYVIEGSVRNESSRIRVSASLVRSRDGLRLWSETYDRNDSDILAIQLAIAQSIARALNLKLSRGIGREGTPPQGEAYRLYLNARGMLRTRNPQLGEQAEALLRRAVLVDPNFAPAWSSLADSIRLKAAILGPEPAIAALAEARSHARRAISLDGRLAEAHGILGILLGTASDEAQAELRLAAKLDPNSAEAQLGLGDAEQAAENIPAAIAAFRRAQALEPYWFRPTRDLALTLAEVGKPSEAESIVRNASEIGLAMQHSQLARIAWTGGDISAAMPIWADGAKRETIWNAPAQVSLATARFTLGLSDKPRPPARTLEWRPGMGRAWLASAPSPDEWQRQNRSEEAALVYRFENIVGAKLMLNAARSRELSETYRSSTGLLGVRRGKPIRANDIHVLPLIVLALRGTGDHAEVTRLLKQADRVVARVRARGTARITFDADIAASHAAAGRDAAAIAALEAAVRRGWTHTGVDDLRGLADEPAFASLQGHPRFRRITLDLQTMMTRERRETLALGLALQ